MFLNDKQILDLLHKGGLVIDPIIEETQVGAFTVDLRLGTELLKFPSPQILLDQRQSHEYTKKIIAAELGQAVQIPAGTGLLGTTLEYLKMPIDLAGILFSRSAWARIGVTMETLTVDPGFQGKLVFPIFNLSSVPAIVYPGQRLLRIGFAQFEPSSASVTRKYAGTIGPQFSFESPQHTEDLEMLKARIAERDRRLTAAYTPKISMKDLLEQALKATGTSKGKALEDFATELFHTVEGIEIISRNQRLMAEEFDLYLQNNITEGFWRLLGSPIIVECKNWSNKVGAKEIGILFDKLSSVSPDAITAILIAPPGITGNQYFDAVAKIREKRQVGRYIIVLDREALEEIADGVQTTKVIEKCYRRMLII